MKETLYYIQNTGRPVGNCARWWAIGGHGYTANLAEAWKVPREKAQSLCRDRPGEDIPWPASAVDALAETHLDVQRLPRFQSSAEAGECIACGYIPARVCMLIGHLYPLKEPAAK